MCIWSKIIGLCFDNSPDTKIGLTVVVRHTQIDLQITPGLRTEPHVLWHGTFVPAPDMESPPTCCTQKNQDSRATTRGHRGQQFHIRPASLLILTHWENHIHQAWRGLLLFSLADYRWSEPERIFKILSQAHILIWQSRTGPGLAEWPDEAVGEAKSRTWVSLSSSPAMLPTNALLSFYWCLS